MLFHKNQFKVNEIVVNYNFKNTTINANKWLFNNPPLICENILI